ncbi:hypothetical protein HYPSUDRAFT_228768 [Hypholoma sublateritium FD-334 SS-4]|uniref:Uncharacterized protein n=1 Tax=Hypholoma sublateritium (strain FD-334 SS-4) TaxID=945553 RepID=A0A0D2PG23_HYPSF|nr:hypothetical protein HYPSUDRAFT_228768 [Hypholoma sublateritium FD-334 SS-4]
MQDNTHRFDHHLALATVDAKKSSAVSLITVFSGTVLTGAYLWALITGAPDVYIEDRLRYRHKHKDAHNVATAPNSRFRSFNPQVCISVP